MATPNYGWVLPVVGADLDDWGDILNTAFGEIDTDLKAVSDVAVAANTASASSRTGALRYFISSSAPTGWVKANGGTVGSAASGGTTRANADTANLFAMLWALNATDYPITTSAGGASTRGASAAADFAANKRLPLPDMRAEFVRGLDDSRGVDTGRVLGSFAADTLKSHNHTYNSLDNRDGSGGTSTTGNTGSGQVTGSTGGTETAPRNVAWLACIGL